MKHLFRNLLMGLFVALLLVLLIPNLRPKNGALWFFEQPVSYHKAVKKASPSVVNLYTRLSNTFLPLGSAIIMSENGYIVTNFHVIDGVNDLVVALQDGRTFTAILLGQDQVTDIAILKVEAVNLPAISYNLDRKSMVGDVVLAIGNPYNIGQTITQGIISAIGRDGLSPSRRQNFIQTDASINHGNSGGALVNSLGELVGLNTLSFSKMGLYEAPEGIGFAIPVDLVVNVMESLITKGKVERGYIGLYGIELNPKMHQIPDSIKTGILVTSVSGSSEIAGLLPDDILIEINHEPIISIVQAMNQIMDLKIGDKIPILYYREGKTYLTDVLVETYPN